MDFILFTEEQNKEALWLNGQTIYKVIPRRIDQPEHPRFGDFAVPDRVATGTYGEFWAGRLADHDRTTAAPEELFQPPEDMP